MKKNILTSLAAMIIATGTMAQSTLQFNQVKLIGSTTETVPTGKIWKIENIVYSTAIPETGTQHAVISIGGTSVTVRTSRGVNIASGTESRVSFHTWEQQLPLWLPESTTLQTSSNVYKISVIEFDVAN
ncbi:MAG: hypothetical protein IT223_11620 [Crocinitomicaceae bacterium]|nr:hypothetical protein [Crocinitomicaceae bacterium]